jgi:integrase
MRKASLVSQDANQHGLVFARDDGRPIDGTALTHDFQATLEAKGLAKMTWHELRHAWVSLMLDAGIPLVEVSQMAGHSGVGITADLYGHLTQEKRAEAIDQMARRLG